MATPQTQTTPAPTQQQNAQQPQPGAPATKPHPSASLYVGELLPEITETRLFEIFNQVGPVASIRVCRDAITRRSLGYAYVNFHSVVDAERALDTLNNHAIRGKPCRIMWSQRDPSVRKSGVGNIFIKNLDTSISHKELYDTFSVFGNILSCKVAGDENGQSKGYGFVHFEGNEAAEKAITKVNGMIMGSMKVYVGRFIPKKEWLKQKETSWTNVFVKNLAPTTTDTQLLDMFKEFGPITSCVMMKESDILKHQQQTQQQAPAPTQQPAPAQQANGTTPGAPSSPATASKIAKDTGFGFINFKNHPDAVRAVEAMNGKVVDGKELYCGRAQKKAERTAELRKKFEQLKLERMTKYQGINLYIKNLEDDVNEERLRKEFGAFGKIKSVKIMDDGKGNSKGFGFVCFTTPEEANRSMTEMNGRILNGCSKPLYVNMHEPKEMRRQKLAAQYAARVKGMRGPPGGGMGPQGVPQQQVGGPIPMGYGPNGQPLFYPGPQGGMPVAGQPQGFYPPAGARRWGPQQQGGAPQQGGQPGMTLPPQQGGQGAPQNYAAMGQRGPQQQGGQRPPQQGGAPQQGGQRPPQQGGQGPQQGGQRPPQQPQQGAPQQGGQRPPQQGGAQPQQAQPQMNILTAQQLALYTPEQQKMLLGERLYHAIHKREPALAGKITGMLLEGGFPDELFALLDNESALNTKVEEAVRVLEEANKKQKEAANAEKKD